jgi:hypothetical protein
MRERLKKSEWRVDVVSLRTAQRIVEKYHYAVGGSNTGTYVHGLFRFNEFFDEQCLGVAWWLPPTRSAALATYPINCEGVLSLSRLAILPGVPANACSFVVSRSRKLIDREKWPCLVTYADEWRGHTGAIYRADNWQYVGLTKPQPVYQINGRLTSRKAGPRTRTHKEMLALGAEYLGRHPKHKYIRLEK